MIEEKLTILHIASDEKFINAANYIFEKAFPKCNHFVIPFSRFRRKLRHVKLENNVHIISHSNSVIRKISKMSEKYDCVFLHGISEFNSSVYLSSLKKERFIGLLWGSELYNEDNFSRNKLLGEITASIKLPKPRYSLNEKIKTILRQLIYNKKVIIKDAIKLAASQLKYICTMYEEESDFFKEKKLISVNAIHIPFSYYPMEYIMKENESSLVNGKNILIGNSASLTNNHLEAFHILKNFNIENRKIIVPLSYGDELYASYIQEKGKGLFGEHFNPLLNFLPLTEYNKVIQGCGIVIMNHYRQQAIGNILSALWLGSKVYLNESNTFFRYLKRIGIKVYSMDKDFSPENQYTLCNLSVEDMDHNRRIMERVIGEKYIIERLKQSVHSYFS